MRRDVILGSLTAIGLSFFVFQNYFKAGATYRKFDVSPIVYKPDIQPATTRKGFKVSLPQEPIKTYKPAYSVEVNPSTFEDSYNLETYMELPLETEGRTAQTDTLYNDVAEESPVEDVVFVKYLRFQFTAIRGTDKKTVHLGGFQFFQGSSVSSSKPIRMWNPHSGEKSSYNGGAWSDSDQHTIVFCFSEPVIVTRYELKSSKESSEFDPIRWKIEGSMSGSYWTLMDDRSDSETAFPVERNRTMIYTVNV